MTRATTPGVTKGEGVEVGSGVGVGNMGKGKTSTVTGINTVFSKDSVANNRQAPISSWVSPSYSFNISVSLAPCASRLRMYSTVKRVPLITGFPVITLGFRVIRLSKC